MSEPANREERRPAEARTNERRNRLSALTTDNEVARQTRCVSETGSGHCPLAKALAAKSTETFRFDRQGLCSTGFQFIPSDLALIIVRTRHQQFSQRIERIGRCELLLVLTEQTGPIHAIPEHRA